MPAVRIADRKIWVGDESRALLSGEVHYWRLDPSVWPDVLARARDLGLDVLSSYVCWDFHELEPGQFDFNGSTNARRNLLGFLELAQREGLWVLIRPGPYIYAEWPNSGVPERVVQWHRLHPEYVAEAKRWMSCVVDPIQPFFATHGGPIVMLQADNEADPWTDVYGSQIGLGATPGLFQTFLHQRYTRIADLNAAWGTHYRNFRDARAFLTPLSDEARPRYVDVCRFRHWYATHIVRWTTEEYRRLGVDVPIYANSYIETSVQDWRSLEAACGLAGPDIYPTSVLATSADEHRGVLDAVRYARSYSRLAFIPEFESGIWHGWHRQVGVLEATHYELNAFAALQAGVHGWSWYMLASRDNWYMSPITELGRFRPELAPAFKEIVRLYREVNPPALEKVCETAVTFNALERGAALDEAGQAVLRALFAADIDYESFDVATGAISKPLLFYAGGPLLSEDEVDRMQAYVRSGGTLVCFQPTVALLGVQLPSRVTSAARPHRVRLTLNNQSVELSSPSVYAYDDVPGEALVAERIEPLPSSQEGGHVHLRLPVGERMTVGYVRHRERGRLVVLGLEPTPELMLALHALLGVRIASHARASTASVHSALFRRAGDGAVFSFLTNTSNEARDVALELDVDLPIRSARDLRTGVESPVVGSTVTLRVPARSGTVVQLLVDTI
jgi:hypothetical protein